MTITVEGLPELEKTLDGFEKVITKTFWDDVQDEFLENLERRAAPHIDTGIMQRNLYSKRITNGVEAGISSDGMMVNWNGARVNYAAFVLHGTRPHIIEPRNKKALRWTGENGRFMFAKKVKHPGYKGDDFLTKAAEDTMDNLQKILDENLKQAGVY